MLQQIDITKIKPYEKNSKRHDQKQIDALAKIIQEVGWRQPVLINQDNVIVVGHGRYETWLKNKDKLKPIWIIDDKGKTVYGEAETKPMTEAQERTYRIADNKLAEMAEWDTPFVIEELTSLDGVKATEIDVELIELIGFDIDEIQNTTAEIEEKEGKKLKEITCPDCNYQFQI